MATYPLPVFHFQVEWNGSNIGFSEVSGLTTEKEMIEYRDGSEPSFNNLKMPGMNKYSNITLKRGIVPSDNEFFDWLNSAKMNVPQRRDLTISLLNEEHAPVMVWKVTQAWPLKVEGPSLNATGNETAIETIEICHEGLTIQND